MSILKFKISPTIPQHSAWKYLHDDITTEILLGGGAGGGKSFFGSFWVLTSALRHAGSRWLIGRAVLKNLKESTLLTFFDLMRKMGIREGQFKYKEIDGQIIFNNDSAIYLKDLDYYPGDPEYDRLGSTEYTGAFIDEGNQIRWKAKNVIASRLRYRLDDFGLTPKMLITCNPDKGWPYQEFYKPAKEGKLPAYRQYIQALATDNPHNSSSYIDQLKRLDKVTRERVLYGNWEYDDDPLSLFSADSLSDLFTNPAEESAKKYITCDVARFGNDKTVIMIWHGLKCVRIVVLKKRSTSEAVNELITIAEREQIPRSRILVDEDGVGGGVVDQGKFKGFMGGSSPITKPNKPVNYQNLRAQCYYMLAEYTERAKVAVDTDVDEYRQAIIEELEQVKAKDVDKDGKLKIIPKDSIKEHLGRSPDYADCLMMRMWFELNKSDGPHIRWL